MAFAFGDHVLDVERRELRRGDEPVALEPQVFDLLVYLVRNRERVVSKDDLIESVWGGRIVSDSAVTTRLNAARKAVGDSGAAQLFIRTVHRKGIRFVAEVRDEGSPQPQPIAVPIDAALAEATLALPDKPSIAVLPFQNMSGDPEQEYFADGMVEEITTALSRIRWLFVIARNSSFTYKGRAIDVKQVARELGVRYVLEGSVRKGANRVRITAQLIDTETGAHIWADRFDGSLDDIFELQDKIASSVVGTIEPKLQLAEIERATRKPSTNLDHYDLYLRALSQFHRLTPEGHTEALRLLERALEIEPFYAPAAAMVGWCRVIQAVHGWVEPTGSEIANGVRLARQALEVGRDDPDCLWMAGYTVLHLMSEQRVGAAAIERALSLNPNCAHAWLVHGWVHCFANRPEQGIAAINQAMRLSPVDPLGYMFTDVIGLAHLIAARYDEAMEWINRSLAEQPRFLPAVRIKVSLCGLLGLKEEATEWVARVLELHPHLTVRGFDRFARTFFSPEVRIPYVEGLRKAGIPPE